MLRGVTGKGKVRVVYGESAEEADAGTEVDVWEDVALDAAKAADYAARAKALREKVVPTYWNDAAQGLLSFRDGDGKVSELTRYPNIFGLFCDYFTPAQRESVVKNVLRRRTRRSCHA